MNKNIKSMFLLIDAALSEKTVRLADDADFNGIYELAKKHNIIPLVFLGLDANQLSGLSIADDVTAVISQAIFVCQKRAFEVKKVCSAFEQGNVDFMLLKGNSMHDLYPNPIMRLMGDTDILIRMEQYGKVRELLSELGYKEGAESDHDFLWKKSFLNLEVHKVLFSKGNADFYSYFCSIWDMVSKKSEESSEYVLNDEDNYLYMFAHFAKHYRVSGIGYKHFIDIYLFLKSKNLDMEYVNTELEKLGLYEFHNNILSAIECVFGGKEITQKDEFILESIASYGTFGNNEYSIISMALRESKKNSRSAKLNFLIKHCFPPYREMKIRYSKWCPIALLLPLAWIVRLFDLALCRKNVVKLQIDNIKKLSNENLTEKQQLLKYVGLEFKK